VSARFSVPKLALEKVLARVSSRALEVRFFLCSLAELVLQYPNYESEHLANVGHNLGGIGLLNSPAAQQAIAQAAQGAQGGFSQGFGGPGGPGEEFEGPEGFENISPEELQQLQAAQAGQAGAQGPESQLQGSGFLNNFKSGLSGLLTPFATAEALRGGPGPVDIASLQNQGDSGFAFGGKKAAAEAAKAEKESPFAEEGLVGIGKATGARPLELPGFPGAIALKKGAALPELPSGWAYVPVPIAEIQAQQQEQLEEQQRLDPELLFLTPMRKNKQQ
jgi:hypothetical protein